METACQEDNTARENGEPAVNKLKMLPEVVGVLNRNTIRHTVVDPETNFLQSVKFFLEPLNDGSLPAYNIQRDLFQALENLPIDKEALMSSGIGKVVLYYTKSKRPEIGIKRIAERLLADWSRPILKRSDDYKKRKIATADYDARYLSLPILYHIGILTILSAHPSSPTAPTHSPSTSPRCPSATWSASVFWLNQNSPTVPGSRPTLLLTLLRQDQISRPPSKGRQARGRQVVLVWRLLGG